MFGCRIGADHAGLDAGGGMDIVFRTDVADAGDDPHQGRHLPFRSRIRPLPLPLRKRLQHQGPTLSRQHAPDLLGDEGGNRMHQLQHDLEHRQQDAAGIAPGMLVVAEQVGLDPLQVPVAELVPDELVVGRGHLVELVAVKPIPHRRDRRRGPAEDPAMDQRQPLRPVADHPHLRAAVADVHQGEAGGVPDLVDEKAIALDPVLVEADLAALGGEGGEGEAHRVGAVAVHDLKRIDDVAGRFRHLLAMLVAHQGVEVDVLERHLVHEVQPHHHHPRHPEEEDVEAGDQDRGRVEGRQFPGPLRPAQGRKGPQGRGEPGVEDVVLLLQAGGTALRATPGIGRLDDQLAAVAAGPGRDAVPPPDLAGDAPVADVVHPAVKGVVPGPGVDPDPSLAHRRHRLVGQGPDRDEPLHRSRRLDDRLAAVAEADGMVVVLDLVEQTQFLEIGHHLFAAGEAVKALIFAGRLVHDSHVVHDLEQLEAMPATDLVVVAIVGRGDLEGAGAEIHLHVVVVDHRDGAAGERQTDADSGQVAVALVVGMDRDAGIAEHGLGPGGGHHDVTGAVGIGIADMVKLAFPVLVFDLVIGEGGMAARAPVDDIVTLVDQAFLVQADEDLAHRRRQPFVHRESLALPVAGGAEPLQLVDDRPALVLAPAPDLVDEGLAAEVMPGLALFRQLPLDDVLGGDAGVIGAWQPQGVVAAHAVIAGKDVLQGVVEGVADMEDAGDVGRRDDDRERGPPLLHLRREAVVLQPVPQPFFFDEGELVPLAQQVFFFACHDQYVESLR